MRNCDCQAFVIQILWDCDDWTLDRNCSQSLLAAMTESYLLPNLKWPQWTVRKERRDNLRCNCCRCDADAAANNNGDVTTTSQYGKLLHRRSTGWPRRPPPSAQTIASIASPLNIRSKQLQDRHTATEMNEKYWKIWKWPIWSSATLKIQQDTLGTKITPILQLAAGYPHQRCYLDASGMLHYMTRRKPAWKQWKVWNQR